MEALESNMWSNMKKLPDKKNVSKVLSECFKQENEIKTINFNNDDGNDGNEINSIFNIKNNNYDGEANNVCINDDIHNNNNDNCMEDVAKSARKFVEVGSNIEPNNSFENVEKSFFSSQRFQLEAVSVIDNDDTKNSNDSNIENIDALHELIDQVNFLFYFLFYI
jgi:hypothetical protein